MAANDFADADNGEAVIPSPRHCERSEAIQGRARTLDCFASLAMTEQK